MIKIFIKSMVMTIIIVLVYIGIKNVYGGDWTNSTDQKVKIMQEKFEMPKGLAYYIVSSCKYKGKSAGWCVTVATHTRNHESGRGKSERAIRNQSPFGLFADKKKYDNFIYAFDDWFWRYNKYRYNNNCETMITKSRYSLSQTSEWVNNCYYVDRVLNNNQ